MGWREVRSIKVLRALQRQKATREHVYYLCLSVLLHFLFAQSSTWMSELCFANERVISSIDQNLLYFHALYFFACASILIAERGNFQDITKEKFP